MQYRASSHKYTRIQTLFGIGRSSPYLHASIKSLWHFWQCALDTVRIVKTKKNQGLCQLTSTPATAQVTPTCGIIMSTNLDNFPESYQLPEHSAGTQISVSNLQQINCLYLNTGFLVCVCVWICISTINSIWENGAANCMRMHKPIISFLHLWVSGWPTTSPQGSRYSRCRECPFPQNNTNCDWNSKNEIRLPCSFERFCSPSKNEHSHPNKHEKQSKFFVTALHCVSDCLSSRVTWLWWRWTSW